MTFIVTLVALLIERFFDWSHLRYWQWYDNYQHAIAQRLPGKSAILILALTVIPLMIVVALIDHIFQGFLFDTIKYLFELAVLLFCLGPQNFWADSFAAINALVQGDAQHAATKLKTAFGITNTGSSQSSHQALLKQIFIEANQRVFAVVFWFVVLGPAGAIMYRTISLSAEEMAANSEFAQQASSFQELLNWIPVRIFTGIFALGGHFAKVIACWNKKLMLDLKTNEVLLTECGTAALGIDAQASLPEDGSVEKSAVSMLDRSFVITLVVIAIISLLF